MGDAETLEGFAEVEEMCPSGVAGDESSGYVESGVVVQGDKESLFLGTGPPLVDGTIVLEEYAKSGATKAAIGTWFFHR